MASNDSDDKTYAPPAEPGDAAGEGDGGRPVPLTNFEKRFRHPPGLFILFFTEMWERFSYYGMRGLLKLYMVNYLFITIRQSFQGKAFDAHGDPMLVWGWNAINKLLPEATNISECVAEKVKDLTANQAGMTAEIAHKIAEQSCAVGPKASYLYGAYTALVYLTPLFGGMIADRLFGQRRTVVVGGILMAIGHFIMAFENWFFVALLFLIVGNGAFKPNISTQVGNLYAKDDPRRDGAFTIFYMGINLGAFLTNLVCGTLAAVYGWHYGFGAAGVGMCLGLVIYLAGQRYLAPDAMMKAKAKSAAPTEEGKEEAAREAEKQPLTSEEWKRVGALIGLCALNVVFWAVYEQQGNTMQTWADTKTVWPTFFGWTVPSTWFQSFNPFFIFLLAPLLDMFWAWQKKRDAEPTSVTKMAIGCFLLGGSFVFMIVGNRMIGDAGGAKGSLFWPVACTLMLTVGELYLSPIGLSLVTKVSPARIVSMMMGMWFLSSFFGNFLSGVIGALYEGRALNAQQFFMLLTGLGIATGLAIFAFNRPLKKIIGHH